LLKANKLVMKLFALGNDMKLYQYFPAGKNQNSQVRADSQAGWLISPAGLLRRNHQLPRLRLPLGPVMDNPGAVRAAGSSVKRANLHRHDVSRSGHPLLPARQVRVLAGTDGDGPGSCLPSIGEKPSTPGERRIPAQPLQHSSGSCCRQSYGRPGSQCCQGRTSISSRGGAHHSTLRLPRAAVHTIPAKPRGTV